MLFNNSLITFSWSCDKLELLLTTGSLFNSIGLLTFFKASIPALTFLVELAALLIFSLLG